jgi:hypothetical protein
LPFKDLEQTAIQIKDILQYKSEVPYLADPSEFPEM